MFVFFYMFVPLICYNMRHRTCMQDTFARAHDVRSKERATICCIQYTLSSRAWPSGCICLWAECALEQRYVACKTMWYLVYKRIMSSRSELLSVELFDGQDELVRN